MKEIDHIISDIPLFNGLPEDQLHAIKQIAAEKKVNKGEAIFSEGDEGKGFYVVLEGRVKIYKVSAEGKEQILHIFGQGQPFGEVPVFAGQKFPANAQAISKGRVLFFPRTAFVTLITENPSLSLNMLAVMASKLREFSVQIENLSLKEIPARLASYLIYLAFFLAFVYLVLFFADNEINTDENMENGTSAVYYIIVLVSFFIPNIGIMIRRRFKQNRGTYNYLVSFLNFMIILALVFMMSQVPWDF